MSDPDDERKRLITERAYELFLARGGEHGLHEADWVEAERQLTAEGKLLARPVAQGEPGGANDASPHP